MSAGTGISYLDATWNPTSGCSHSGSPGCDRCWAKRMATRLRGRYGYPKDHPFKPTCHPDRLEQPLHWKKPRRIGVSFMGDLFHDQIKPAFIHKVWLTMRNSSRHTYFLLTKRPDNLFKWTQFAANSMCWPVNEIWPDNVYLGVSVENQRAANERIPISPFVRWLSIEPMLGPVSLTEIKPTKHPYITYNVLNGTAFNDLAFRHSTPNMTGNKINFVVCGAETGPGASPMDLAWARDLRDQCRELGVPFYMKQVSGKQPIPPDLMIRELP